MTDSVELLEPSWQSLLALGESQCRAARLLAKQGADRSVDTGGVGWRKTEKGSRGFYSVFGPSLDNGLPVATIDSSRASLNSLLEKRWEQIQDDLDSFQSMGKGHVRPAIPDDLQSSVNSEPSEWTSSWDYSQFPGQELPSLPTQDYGDTLSAVSALSSDKRSHQSPVYSSTHSVTQLTGMERPSTSEREEPSVAGSTEWQTAFDEYPSLGPSGTEEASQLSTDKPVFPSLKTLGDDQSLPLLLSKDHQIPPPAVIAVVASVPETMIKQASKVSGHRKMSSASLPRLILQAPPMQQNGRMRSATLEPVITPLSAQLPSITVNPVEEVLIEETDTDTNFWSPTTTLFDLISPDSSLASVWRSNVAACAGQSSGTQAQHRSSYSAPFWDFPTETNTTSAMQGQCWSPNSRTFKSKHPPAKSFSSSSTDRRQRIAGPVQQQKERQLKEELISFTDMLALVESTKSLPHPYSLHDQDDQACRSKWSIGSEIDQSDDNKRSSSAATTTTTMMTTTTVGFVMKERSTSSIPLPLSLLQEHPYSAREQQMHYRSRSKGSEQSEDTLNENEEREALDLGNSVTRSSVDADDHDDASSADRGLGLQSQQVARRTRHGNVGSVGIHSAYVGAVGGHGMRRPSSVRDLFRFNRVGRWRG